MAKFQGTGNGGYSGAIVYTALELGCGSTTPTANTDMGHVTTTPDPASWALHHPELVVDQGYRAQHVTAVTAKAIVALFTASIRAVPTLWAVHPAAGRRSPRRIVIRMTTTASSPVRRLRSGALARGSDLGLSGGAEDRCGQDSDDFRGRAGEVRCREESPTG